MAHAGEHLSGFRPRFRQPSPANPFDPVPCMTAEQTNEPSRDVSTRPRAPASQPPLEAHPLDIMHYYDSLLENAIDGDNVVEFPHALSVLGEALAARFTLEDELILLAFDNNLHASANDEAIVARPA